MLRKRRISRKLRKHGVQTTLYRKNAEVQLDRYGEPIDSDSPFDTFSIYVVVDKERQVAYETGIGALTDDKKQYLFLLVDGYADVRHGDKILFPPTSNDEWIVQFLEPQYVEGEVVYSEIKAYRDDRT